MAGQRDANLGPEAGEENILPPGRATGFPLVIPYSFDTNNTTITRTRCFAHGARLCRLYERRLRHAWNEAERHPEDDVDRPAPALIGRPGRMPPSTTSSAT